MSTAATQRPLREIVPESWLKEPNCDEIMLVGYSSSLDADAPTTKMALEIAGIASRIALHPVRVAFANLVGENAFHNSTLRSLYRNGQRLIEVKIDKEIVPEGHYALFLSPVVKTENGSNEGNARDSIALARGMLGCFFGHTAAEQKSFSMTLNTRDERANFASPIVETFRFPLDFQFASEEAVRECFERSKNASTQFKQRLSTSFLFLSRGLAEMDSTVRFSHMWIALEVIAGSYGKAEMALANVGGSGLHRDAARKIKDARRALVHDGKRYVLTQVEERHICIAIASKLFEAFGINDAGLRGVAQRLYEKDGDVTPPAITPGRPNSPRP